MPEPENIKCKIFLGYTSNLVSAGVREHIRYLAQHQMVDVLCTSAGGIEEDFIKVCLCTAYTALTHYFELTCLAESDSQTVTGYANT